MNQRLRLPPYGPATSAIGAGAVLQSQSVVNSEASSAVAISESDQELQSSLSVEPDCRVSLAQVKQTSWLRVRVEMDLFQVGEEWGGDDGNLLIALQLSRDPTLGGWSGVGTSQPAILANILNVGEPSTYNNMRHTIRFEAEAPATSVPFPERGTTITARVLMSPSLENGLYVDFYEGEVTVTIEEIVDPTGATDVDDLRRPSAGPYRALRLGGSVVQEAPGRMTGGGTALVTGTEAALAGVAPALTPLRSSSVLRLITQLIVMTADEAWITAETILVSLQLSDDAGGSWVEVGVLEAVLEPSLNTTGEPDVANNTRSLFAYQADVAILDAFPAYAGGEIVGRVTRSCAALPNVASIVGEGGNVGSSWLKLQEIRA